MPKQVEFEIRKTLRGWTVIVTAPETEWGGWAFTCDNEHSANLAVDAMLYLMGQPTPYSEEKWNGPG